MDQVAREWYKAELPGISLLKRDLEFISREWTYKNFDLWEEVDGHHFYTRMVQYAALRAGGVIANSFNDTGASSFYLKIASTIETDLVKFYDAKRKFIKVTLEPRDDRGKTSSLDIASILACLHTRDFPHPLFSCESAPILLTALKLVAAFHVEYPINWFSSTPLIGRYPEDVYDGTGSSLGNPWILATHAIAELLYHVANAYARRKQITPTIEEYAFYSRFAPSVELDPGKPITGTNLAYLCGNLSLSGDSFLERVEKISSLYDGRLSEQIQRDTGEMVGAIDLTWSYSSLLTALRTKSER